MANLEHGDGFCYNKDLKKSNEIFQIESSKDFFSDKKNWIDIKSWLKDRYNGKSGISLAYINGNHGIGKTSRIKILADEIGFNQIILSINRINDQSDIELFINKLTKSRSILEIFDENRNKKKLIIIDGTECSSIYPKVNKTMNMILKLIEKGKLNENFTVVFVGFLMIVKINKKLQNNVTKYNLLQPSIEEATNHIQKCVKKSGLKIDVKSAKFISSMVHNDIGQIHQTLNQIFISTKIHKIIDIDIGFVNKYFSENLIKNQTYYLYESTQMMFDPAIDNNDKIINLEQMNNEYMFPLMIYDNIKTVIGKNSKYKHKYIEIFNIIMDSFVYYDQFSTRFLNTDDIVSRRLHWVQLIDTINMNISIKEIPDISKFSFTKVINKKALRTVTMQKQMNCVIHLNLNNIETIMKICCIIKKIIMNNDIKSIKSFGLKNCSVDLVNLLRCDKMIEAKDSSYVKQLKKYSNILS